MKPIKRLLVANRGEIAVRIIRAAKELGIETVAIYSEPDRRSLHVRLADERIFLGGSSAKETYLHQEKIIDAAIQANADALHPGYGFFSENAGFAQAVVDQGINFIGPSPEVIALMGNKDEARKKARSLGIPLVPGTEGEGTKVEGTETAKKKIESDESSFLGFAEAIGYPIMVKAVAGGSGRGMRVVLDAKDLKERLGEARREALAAFGNETVFLEKYISTPRHIEVQVFGDKFGNVIHLGERECSVQRRHQKLIEEAPAPFLHPTLREKLRHAAVNLARAVSYVGAGTIEFLVEEGKEENSPFYFLEMNTRIQVEHPVTEEATGLDLVKMQLLVAKGERLPVRQEEIHFYRHALEFRIYAENPKTRFSPTSGTIAYLSRPGGPGVREDSWCEAGTTISSYYDSLISKLVVSGRDRQETIERAKCVLDQYLLEGFETTLGFHRWILTQEAFHTGAIDVHWIEREYQGEVLNAEVVGPLILKD